MRRYMIIPMTAASLLAAAARAQTAAPGTDPAFSATSTDPAFAAFGGEPGIAKIVDDGVERVLRDDRIKAKFDNANIPRLKIRLTLQFCLLLGGNCTYEGRTMAEAHAGMGIRNADFNALAEDFQLAMDDAGVPFRYQNVLLKQLAPMQHDIVTK
jgi:hemoglobin